MSRSGYSDDFDDGLALGRWRAQVGNSIRGKRGQAFLRELAAAMDAMPVKEIIPEELIDDEGQCCTIGVVCKARGIDVSSVDVHDTREVGGLVGITHQLAAEIAYENDECGRTYVRSEGGRWKSQEETPAQRWQRMRRWVEKSIAKSE